MSSFINNLRGARADNQALNNEIDTFNASVKALSKKYAKANGIKEDEAEKKIREFVRYAGKNDGSLSDGSTGGDVAKYGNQLFADMNVGDIDMGFNDYIEKYGSDEQKKAYDTLQRMSARTTTPNEAAAALGIPGGILGAGLAAAPLTGGVSIPIGALGALAVEGGELLGYISDKGNQSKSEKLLNAADSGYAAAKKKASEDVFDIITNYRKYISDGPESANGTKAAATGGSGNSQKSSNSGAGDTVTFTLPRANDPNYRGFGAKLQELGLTTDKGLWGANGDVEFYTKQLYDQGALDSRGNLKIGVPITLRRRK